MFLNQNILDKLLKDGEGEKLDFKQKISDKRKIAKTIASFANNLGGIILVGVKDDKSLVVIDPEEEMYMINEASAYYCDPPIEIKFEELEDDETGLVVLMVEIQESQFKPHSAKIKEDDWRIYIRQNDKSVLASQMNISLMKKGFTASKSMPPLTIIEKHLVDYLHANERITLKQFMKLVNIGKRRASRILTAMVISGLIKYNDFEKDGFYSR